MLRQALLSTGLLLLLASHGRAQVTPPTSGNATSASANTGYRQPSAPVREVLDAPALPRLLISPDRKTLATLELRRFSSLAELARPTLKLAGLRFDAASGLPAQTAAVQRLQLRPLLEPQAAARELKLPGGGMFHSFAWAPDGQRFLLQRRNDGSRSNELWVGDTASGRLRQVPGLKLSGLFGTGAVTAGGDGGGSEGEMAWLSPTELVLRAVPRQRGPAPQAPAAPEAPLVLESSGRPTPERALADMLRSGHDEQLFAHHALTRLALVELDSLRSREIGEPGLFTRVSSVGLAGATPGGPLLLTEQLARPFSRSQSWEDFPQRVELRRRDGKVLRELARLPARRGLPLYGVLPGPRHFIASPNADAAVYWVEAMDGGQPGQRAPFRDRLMRLNPPYTGEPLEVQRLPNRFSELRFIDDGQHALLSEEDRARAWTRVHLQPLDGKQSRPLFDSAQRERYRQSTAPLLRTLANGHRVALTQAGHLLLQGSESGPRGERPFLDRYRLRDGQTQRQFQSGDSHFEQALELLDGQGLLTVRESATEAPHLALHGSGGATRLLSSGSDPSPALRRLRRELVSFKRSDGVEMSFSMVLPPDYKEGERRPALVWAYPLEYSDGHVAGQVNGASNRFQTVSGISPLLLALEGYVVFMDATMPIVGDPKTVNDEFIEQLMMNARAIVEKIDDLGVSHPRHLAVGGHSYGAFMAVNLLAQTNLFRTAIARSGAYNRTLTPFGFQNERRTLWEAKPVYLQLSPFLQADKIKEPLLLIHGDTDPNPGTLPMQSERLYQALAGLGRQARYVALPLEGHGYGARESIGHVQWEMSQWLRSHLGPPRPLR